LRESEKQQRNRFFSLPVFDQSSSIHDLNFLVVLVRAGSFKEDRSSSTSRIASVLETLDLSHAKGNRAHERRSSSSREGGRDANDYVVTK